MWSRREEKTEEVAEKQAPETKIGFFVPNTGNPTAKKLTFAQIAKRFHHRCIKGEYKELADDFHSSGLTPQQLGEFLNSKEGRTYLDWAANTLSDAGALAFLCAHVDTETLKKLLHTNSDYILEDFFRSQATREELGRCDTDEIQGRTEKMKLLLKIDFLPVKEYIENKIHNQDEYMTPALIENFNTALGAIKAPRPTKV